MYSGFVVTKSLSDFGCVVTGHKSTQNDLLVLLNQTLMDRCFALYVLPISQSNGRKDLLGFCCNILTNGES